MDGMSVSDEDHRFLGGRTAAADGKRPLFAHRLSFYNRRFCQWHMTEQPAFARIQFVVAQAIGQSRLLWRKQQQRTLAIQDDPGLEGVGRNAPRLLRDD